MKKNYSQKSKVLGDLIKAGIFKKKNTSVFSNRTRDRNVKVFKDNKTGVIFIPKYRSDINAHYKKKNEELFVLSHNNIKADLKSKKINLDFENIRSRGQEHGATGVDAIGLSDEKRRFNFLKNKIKNKTLLDFGCGTGNFLLLIKKNAKSVAGLEVRKQYIDLLSKNFKIYDDISVVDKKFDFITLFHVLEHIPNQIETLKNLKKFLKKNGKLIIEVPHANDVLLNLKTFRDFTLWSEHLVLHTKLSLTKYLKVAGFKVDKLQFIQRYNFLNHFKWFTEGKPGGHETNQNFYNKDIVNYYNKFLIEKETTDTLFVEAKINSKR